MPPSPSLWRSPCGAVGPGTGGADALRERHTRSDGAGYLGLVADKSSRNIAKPAAGIIGVLATIASVWWFALRPRRKARKSA